jgi:hypothetical protein
MAGHSLLNQVRAKSEALTVGGETYSIVLTYNKVLGIDGYVVGLKFSDAVGSMDSAKAKPVHGIQLSLAIAHRVIQMIKPDSDSVEILGYYLLTDELDVRKVDGTRQKKRLYGNQANKMQQAFKDKLQHLANFEVEGGAAWVLSAKPYSNYEQFKLLEKELAKQLRVTLC